MYNEDMNVKEYKSGNECVAERLVMSFLILIVGILNGIGSMMPFWCVVVTTLGFGVLFAFPLQFIAPIIIYVLLMVLGRSKNLLGVLGKFVYILMSVLGFFIGLGASFGVAAVMPVVSLGANSAKFEVVLICYLVCMFVVIGSAQVLRYFIDRWAKRTM